MRLLCLPLILLIFSIPAFAQNIEEEKKLLTPITFLDYLREHNRIKPMQNPKHEHGIDILDRRIMDQTKKAIGQVKDVVVSTDGKIRYLKIDFDKISLRKEVYLDYHRMNIGANNDGYTLPFRKEEIKDLYSKFTRQITPHSDQISLVGIIGKEIRDTNKIRLGTIDEILFDEFGSKVELIYMTVDYGVIRDKGLAIPFESVKFDYRNGYVYPTIEKEFSDIVLDYVRK
ncbi:MAG: PRC-barrel domain-containing protein [Alphaproteobacteria bacterium]|nr:PRC-barrel domain-containing protein [Alphaproteobacteria bacterium]